MATTVTLDRSSSSLSYPTEFEKVTNLDLRIAQIQAQIAELRKKMPDEGTVGKRKREWNPLQDIEKLVTEKASLEIERNKTLESATIQETSKKLLQQYCDSGTYRIENSAEQADQNIYTGNRYRFKWECPKIHVSYKIKEVPASLRGFMIWSCGSTPKIIESKLFQWRALSCPGMVLYPETRKNLLEYLEQLNAENPFNSYNGSNELCAKFGFPFNRRDLRTAVSAMETLGVLFGDAQLSLTDIELKNLQRLTQWIDFSKNSDNKTQSFQFSDLKRLFKAYGEIAPYQNLAGFWTPLAVPLASLTCFVIAHPSFYGYISFEKLIPLSGSPYLIEKIKDQLWDSLNSYIQAAKTDPSSPLRRKILHLLGVLADATPHFAKRMHDILSELHPSGDFATVAQSIIESSTGTKMFVHTTMLMLAEKAHISWKLTKELMDLILGLDNCYSHPGAFPQLAAVLSLCTLLTRELDTPLPEDFSVCKIPSFEELETDDSILGILSLHLHRVFSQIFSTEAGDALTVLSSLTKLVKLKQPLKLPSTIEDKFYSTLLSIDLHNLDDREIDSLLESLEQLVLSYPPRYAHVSESLIIFEFVTHLIKRHDYTPERLEVVKRILNTVKDALTEDQKTHTKPSAKLKANMEKLMTMIENFNQRFVK